MKIIKLLIAEEAERDVDVVDEITHAPDMP
jgi:hypothetical protein